MLSWGEGSCETPDVEEGSGGPSDFKRIALSFWSISKTKKSVNLGYRVRFRQKSIEVLHSPLLYHRLDRRNIPTNVFGNSYIGFEHLREFISVGSSISSNSEQGVAWWQNGSLHHLRRGFSLVVVKFLSFRWWLVGGRRIFFTETVGSCGVGVSH